MTTRALTAHQVAERFGVGVQTIARWTRAGYLTAIPTRWGKRYRLADVEAALAAANTEP